MEQIIWLVDLSSVAEGDESAQTRPCLFNDTSALHQPNVAGRDGLW